MTHRRTTRPSDGPAFHALDRADYERTMAEYLVAQHQPTDEEWALIRRAASRWKKKDPTPADIMGDTPRPGLESLVSLVALGVV